MKLRFAALIAAALLLPGCDASSPNDAPTSAAGTVTEATAAPTVSPEQKPLPNAVQKPGTIVIQGRVTCGPDTKLHLDQGTVRGGVYIRYAGSVNPPSGDPEIIMLDDGHSAIYWMNDYPATALPYEVNVMCGTKTDRTALSDFFTVPEYRLSVLVDCSAGLKTPTCVVTEYKP